MTTFFSYLDREREREPANPKVTIKTMSNQQPNWVVLARMFAVPLVASADTLENSSAELPAVSVVTKADILTPQEELPTALLEQTP